MYSTKKSLIDTWGEDIVQTLVAGRDLQDDVSRFEKARSIAAALIDSKLSGAGYQLPLLFTDYDFVFPEVPPVIPLPPKLNLLLQQASDCFTIYYLAQGYDLMQKGFDDCRREWLSWLDDLKANKEDLDYPKTATPTSHGDTVVLARRSILDGGYPGCCGRRWYNAVN
jgi:hypothetical protein